MSGSPQGCTLPPKLEVQATRIMCMFTFQMQFMSKQPLEFHQKMPG